MHTALLLSHSFLLHLRRNDLSVHGIVSYCSKAVNISIRSLETMVSKWDSYRMTLYIVAVSTGGKRKTTKHSVLMTQMFLSQFTWSETSVFGSITFQDNAWLFGILATECWSESNLWVMRQLSPTIRPTLLPAVTLLAVQSHLLSESLSISSPLSHFPSLLVASPALASLSYLPSSLGLSRWL